jgi:hypothetical protein
VLRRTLANWSVMALYTMGVSPARLAGLPDASHDAGRSCPRRARRHDRRAGRIARIHPRPDVRHGDERREAAQRLRQTPDRAPVLGLVDALFTARNHRAIC